MKKIRILCGIAAIVLLCGLFSACARKNDETEPEGMVTASGCGIAVETDDLLKWSPLIFLGKVTAEGDGRYTNPDGTKKENGSEVYNQWLTPYTVEILEVYKGTLHSGVKELTVAGFRPTSPEDYDPNVVASGSSGVSFEIGKTAVFCVTYSEANECYETIYGSNGVFYPKDKEGVYGSLGKDDIHTKTIREDIKNANPKHNVVTSSYRDLHIKESDRAVVED